MSIFKNNIPNAITSMNLLCGTLAIIASFHCLEPTLLGLSGYELAFVLIALAAVADFLDGFAARLLHAVSGIGAELDSLSDLVSFGLAPAMVLYNMMQAAAPDSLLCYSAVLLPVAGALRLARFNVDTNQTTTFTGLPIPANAIFWIGFTSWYATHHTISQWVTVAFVVVLSYLMVSPLRMFSLKMHSMSLRENWVQYLLVAITVILVALMGLSGLACVIVLYVFLSIVKQEK
ncbi:MAG: CDP-diacylglycerol--serine O-phosphatidyltransferase [Bacteroidales bacterium]|nr:CDP-diacylglycerol--serine O-phosphatidyltransferase [Candidatus Sodaliphilus aphodohippi]